MARAFAVLLVIADFLAFRLLQADSSKILEMPRGTGTSLGYNEHFELIPDLSCWRTTPGPSRAVQHKVIGTMY